MKLLLATRNPGKLREQREALSVAAVELVDLSAWPDLSPAPEPGSSYLENAVVKALYYSRATGLPVLGDDSGLEVEALGGAPGIQSSRWLGEETSYETKCARLLEAMAGIGPQRRAGRYVCALALADGGGVRFTAVEACEGFIAEHPEGQRGFGYDPIFYFPALGKTFGEASAEEKSRVSHRGKALARVADYLDRLAKGSL